MDTCPYTKSVIVGIESRNCILLLFTTGQLQSTFTPLVNTHISFLILVELTQGVWATVILTSNNTIPSLPHPPKEKVL